MTSPKDKIETLSEVLQVVKEIIEKSGEVPDMASPDNPKGLDNKRKPVTHDECGRPFAKDEDKNPEHIKWLKTLDSNAQQNAERMTDSQIKDWHARSTAVKKDDDLDAKIKAKMKQEMDRRNFGEADATRHMIDRDRGDKQPAKPKNQLLQSELIKALSDAGLRNSALLLKNWGEMDEVAEEFYKSNYGPKDLGLYDAAANQKRKQTRTGDEVEGAGQNKGVRQYTSAKMGTAKQQAGTQAKVDADKNKKQPVKTYSPDELKAFAEARGTSVSDKMKKEENTLNYKKINPKPAKVDDDKAPAITYGDGEPKMRNEWKGKEVSSKKVDPKNSAKQESKEDRIRQAVKQGKVIDDRPKGTTQRVQQKPAAAPKPAVAETKPDTTPIKTAAQTLRERAQMKKADLEAKTIPDIKSSAEMAPARDDKMKDAVGVNTKAYSTKNKKKIHASVPKEVADLNKNGQWSLKDA